MRHITGGANYRAACIYWLMGKFENNFFIYLTMKKSGFSLKVPSRKHQYKVLEVSLFI